jgi:hypothetical protein
MSKLKVHEDHLYIQVITGTTVLSEAHAEVCKRLIPLMKQPFVLAH